MSKSQIENILSDSLNKMYYNDVKVLERTIHNLEYKIQESDETLFDLYGELNQTNIHSNKYHSLENKINKLEKRIEHLEESLNEYQHDLINAKNLF